MLVYAYQITRHNVALPQDCVSIDDHHVIYPYHLGFDTLERTGLKLVGIEPMEV